MSLMATSPQNPQTSVQNTNNTPMFETFHQTPHGEFRTSFYNPFEVKHRKRTTRSQFSVLEKAFQENAKPNSTIRKELAQQLDMTPRGVQVWFQNRRAKAKNLGTSQTENSELSGDSGQEGTFSGINSSESNLFDLHQSLYDPSTAFSLNHESLNFSGVGLMLNDMKQNPLLSSRRKSCSRYTPLPQAPRTKRCGSLKVVTSESFDDIAANYQQARASKRSYSLDVPSLHVFQESKLYPSSINPTGSISPNLLTVTPALDMNGLQNYDPLSPVSQSQSHEQLTTPTDENFQQMLLQSSLAPPYSGARRNSCPPEFIASFDDLNFSTPNPHLSTIVEDEGLYMDQRNDLHDAYDMNLKFQGSGFPYLMDTPVSATGIDLSQPSPISAIRAHSIGTGLVNPTLTRINKPGRFNNRTYSEPIIHTPFSQELTNQLNMEMNNEFGLESDNFAHSISQAPNSNLYQSINFSDNCLDEPLFPAMKGRTRIPSKNSKISESLDFLNFDLNQTPAVHDQDCLEESLYFSNP
ncbi:hypothetical protein K7432_003417 [Basidiobolus ranarum]|uniref:Homeobox domain-containing protein n=1 Tax=Basidiobolus ranarum TaxID=34480 RepID=A0ABR2WZY2_9FUNG